MSRSEIVLEIRVRVLYNLEEKANKRCGSRDHTARDRENR